MCQSAVLGRQEEPGHAGVWRVDRGRHHSGEPLHGAQSHLPELVLRHVVTKVWRVDEAQGFFKPNIWRMLSRCSRSYEKVGDLADLKSRFESLSLSNDITQLLALDSFIHRLMGEWETIRWTNCWLMTIILFQASSKFTQFSEPIGTFSKIPCRNSECSRVWINWRRVDQKRKCSDSMMSF